MHSGHIILELDSQLYAIGGSNDKTVIADVEALDLHEGVRAEGWTQELCMLSPRTEHAGTVLGGRIWVTGGFDGDEILRFKSLALFKRDRRFSTG